MPVEVVKIDYEADRFTRRVDGELVEDRPLTADEWAADDERNETVLPVDPYRDHVDQAMMRFLLQRLETNGVLTPAEAQQIRDQANATVAKKRP